MSYCYQKHAIEYCEKVNERFGKKLSQSIKTSREVLDKLKARNSNAISSSTYGLSTIYTTLPHNLIENKRIDLIERTLKSEGSPYHACNDRNAILSSEQP